MPVQRILKKYLNRMLDSVQRSALLSAYPSKWGKSRIDLYQLSNIDSALPNELLESLIYENKSHSIKFQYDELPKIKQTIDDLKEKGLPIPQELQSKFDHLKEIYQLHTTFSQKMPKESDLINRETGLRSLWLGYPLAYISCPGKAILAPIFLWPINIKVNTRKQGVVEVSRDDDAGTPIYNKAFDYWCIKNLGINPDDPSKDELTEISKVRLREILSEIFKEFSTRPSIDLATNILKIPDRQTLKRKEVTCLLNSAILGLIKWENQAVMHDLEELVEKNEFPDIAHSFLTGVYEQDEVETVPEKLAEKDKFFVCHTDQYQEQAVLAARNKPGIIVHGPPGTGKSETIVNIVADCLARNEKVLVCCQKRAAIDVVFERMKGAGISGMAALVHDSNEDRKKIIQSLIDQIDGGELEIPSDRVLKRRDKISSEIELIEARLDEYSRALYQEDEKIKKNYRDIRTAYVHIRAKWRGIRESDGISKLASDIGSVDLDKLDHSMTMLANLYFESKPFKNPWVDRKSDFVINRFLLIDIEKTFNDVIQNLSSLDEGLLAVSSIEAYQNDLENLKEDLQVGLSLCSKNLSESNFEHFKKWSSTDGLQKLKVIIPKIEKILTELSTVSFDHPNHEVCYKFESAQILFLNQLLRRWLEGSSGVRRWIDFGAKAARAKFIAESKRLGINASIDINQAKAFSEYLKSLILCKELRSLLMQLHREDIISLGAETIFSFQTDQRTCKDLVKNFNSLRCLHELQEKNIWKDFLLKIHTFSYADICDFFNKQRLLLESVSLIQINLLGVDTLDAWLSDSKIKKIKESFWDGKIETIQLDLRSHLQNLHTLNSLIKYEAEMRRVDETTRNFFQLLIESLSEHQNGNGTTETVDECSSLARDTLWLNVYAEKARLLEEKNPILRSYSGELYEQDSNRLRDLLKEKKSLESSAIKKRWAEKSASHSMRDWKRVLVVTGKNSKRLRQVVDLGVPQGLFDIRPCWLTNPNTACQIFPLVRDYFDTVIFDEASQCPIEQALPILYRAKKIVVAGDENQLPPTAFFKSGFEIEDDQQEDPLKPDDELTSDELTKKNLQEASTELVLNVEDLLTASKNILKDKYLNVHYRSLHPSLVNFSNHSFYNARLQVPQLGHVKEYSIEPPIIYKNIMGIYCDEVNRDEADAVLQLIKGIWDGPSRPTIGVVTFNSNQRDLIDELLLTECKNNSKFNAIYEEEVSRTSGNQDVGFFVKNLESVQGDERDIIIFSTTFGVNEKGKFLRFFGPINNDGGDKRLNVAITRSKKRMYIITSMPIEQISDILAANQKNPGTKITGREYLHLFMQYTKNIYEGRNEHARATLDTARSLRGYSGSHVQIDCSESEFEQQVADALQARGYEVDNQIGESGFRVDLAIKHRAKDAGYVFGIECDGAAYHSGLSARIRDIWRQSILELRGWNIHRIWSTDWWKDPDKEIDRIVAKVDAIYHIENSEKKAPAPKAPPETVITESSPFSNQGLDVSSGEKDEVIAKLDKKEKRSNVNHISADGKSTNEARLFSEAHLSILGQCNKCREAYKAKIGIYGPYLACKKCKTTTNISREALEEIIEKEILCPDHGVRLKVKPSRRGYFMGCPLYPKCTHTRNVKIKSGFIE